MADQPQTRVDRMILIVVAAEQSGQLTSALLKAGFALTVISPREGFLGFGSTCLLLGIHSQRWDELVQIVQKICGARRRFIPAQGHMVLPEGLPPMMIEAEVGSAYIFSIEVEYFEQF
jgi:uncharacterized protein YaaQ